MCLSLQPQPSLLPFTGKLLRGGVCPCLPLTSPPAVFQLLPWSPPRLLPGTQSTPSSPRGWWSSSVLMLPALLHAGFPPSSPAAPPPHTLPAPAPTAQALSLLSVTAKPPASVSSSEFSRSFRPSQLDIPWALQVSRAHVEASPFPGPRPFTYGAKHPRQVQIKALKTLKPEPLCPSAPFPPPLAPVEYCSASGSSP